MQIIFISICLRTVLHNYRKKSAENERKTFPGEQSITDNPGSKIKGASKQHDMLPAIKRSQRHNTKGKISPLTLKSLVLGGERGHTHRIRYNTLQAVRQRV
jgi:hypothetical protein